MARKSRMGSKEKKAYVQSMMPDKKILFITLSDSLKGDISYNDDHDIILGYNELHDVYAACDATLNKGNSSISFGFKSRDIRENHSIQVRYKSLNKQQSLYERVLLIPCKELESFCKDCDYYLYDYEQDDEKEKQLGVYNPDMDEIELKSE